VTVHHSANLIVLHVLSAGIKRAYFDYKAEDIPIWIRTNLSEYKHEVEGWFCRIKDRYQKQKWEYQQQQQENETANINLEINMVDLVTSVAGAKLSINLFIYESRPNHEKIEDVLFMQIQILNL
jgi:hypothetical protein